MADQAELESRPSLAVEHDLTDEPLSRNHPAYGLQRLGFSSCTVEDPGGKWNPIFAAEIKLEQTELKALIPESSDLPGLTLHISDEPSDGDERHAYFLFGNPMDSEDVDPDIIARKYWEALDRFSVMVLVEGWPGGYDPGPEYPDLRPWKRKGRIEDLIPLERLPVYPGKEEDHEPWPDLVYDLTGDPLPEEHPARLLQDRGFGDCHVIGDGTGFMALKYVELEVGVPAGLLPRTVEHRLLLTGDAALEYEVGVRDEVYACIGVPLGDSYFAYVDEGSDVEVPMDQIPAGDLAAFRHFMRDTHENGAATGG